MRKNIYKNKYGFSLIETLIAVSILMIAIAGPLSLVQAGLFSSIHQRNQVTATFLAQEAMEFIKNLRDTESYQQYSSTPPPTTNWLVTTGSVNLIAVCDGTGGNNGCYVDPHGFLSGASSGGDSFVQSVNSNPNLYLKSKTVFNSISNENISYYTYDSTCGSSCTDTIYQRSVVITPVSSDEVTVTVTVTWKDNALQRSYTVSENIYNYEQ